MTIVENLFATFRDQEGFQVRLVHAITNDLYGVITCRGCLRLAHDIPGFLGYSSSQEEAKSIGIKATKKQCEP